MTSKGYPWSNDALVVAYDFGLPDADYLIMYDKAALRAWAAGKIVVSTRKKSRSTKSCATKVGTCFWVKEPWFAVDWNPRVDDDEPDEVIYEAGGGLFIKSRKRHDGIFVPRNRSGEVQHWSSVYDMPRWASRFDVEVVLIENGGTQWGIHLQVVEPSREDHQSPAP